MGASQSFVDEIAWIDQLLQPKKEEKKVEEPVSEAEQVQEPQRLAELNQEDVQMVAEHTDQKEEPKTEEEPKLEEVETINPEVTFEKKAENKVEIKKL